jgi:outer membrane protein TolC
MIRRRIYFSAVLLVFGILKLSAQTDTIGIFDCYKLVRKNAPQSGLFELNKQATQIEIDKISSGNLPIVSGYGKATYQCDATSMNLPMPTGTVSIEVDKFQYNAGINIDQKLFDGGLVAVQKEIKQTEGEIKNLETEAALYKLNDLVNKYFFGIITMQKSEEILMLRTSSLEERKKNIESGVKNGMVLKAELNRIETEILTTHQQIKEIQVARLQMENSLKTLAGIENTTNIIWKAPENIAVNDSLSRYELQLYQQNRNYADALKQMQSKRYIPRVYAFGQAGYSYPGLNMFENEPAGYYIVGAKLSWQIFDWNQAKKEKDLLDIQKDKIDISEADFNRNLQISINTETEEIDKIHQLMADDEKLIQAREAITKSSASALDNGTITSADYINDLNAELKARFDYERHKISLLESTARLAVLKGIN